MKNAALGMIFSKKQELLLVLRHDVKLWVLPGGGIDDGETPEEACLREVFEETGIHLKTISLNAIYTPINHLASKTFLFHGISDSEATTIDKKEVLDAKFFPLTALPKKIFFLHRTFITEATSAKTIPYTRSLNELTYSHAAWYAITHPIQTILYSFTRFISLKK